MIWEEQSIETQKWQFPSPALLFTKIAAKYYFCSGNNYAYYLLHIFFVFQINLILILHSFCKTKQNQTIVVHLSLQMNFFSLRIYIQEWIIERKLQNWIFLTPTCTGSSSVPENFFSGIVSRRTLCLEELFHEWTSFGTLSNSFT